MVGAWVSGGVPSALDHPNGSPSVGLTSAPLVGSGRARSSLASASHPEAKGPATTPHSQRHRPLGEWLLSSGAGAQGHRGKWSQKQLSLPRALHRGRRVNFQDVNFLLLPRALHGRVTEHRASGAACGPRGPSQ